MAGNLMEDRMKKFALIMAGVVAIILTPYVKGKIEKWVKDKQTEDIAAKAF